jgi:acyl-CoA thioester hydrolase
MLASTPLDVRAFRFPVRIYWEDTDAGGVVFYANYLKFFERARTEWLRHLGFGQEALKNAQRMVFVVTHTELRYLAPARLDELLHLTVRPEPAGRASLVVHQQAWRGDTLLTEGRIRIGCVDADTFRPRRMPDDLINTLLSQAG